MVKINTELGTSIILSEHNLEKVLPLADRAILMDSGKISAEGTPPEIGEKVKALSPEMFAALPTPVRIYCGAGGNGGTPLTVRDGPGVAQTPKHAQIHRAERYIQPVG